MVSYSNGYIPASLLITFNVGWSAGEGEWKHQLSAGTYAKHLALVTLAKRNTGRTLALSAGWSGYRPYSAQVYARKRYGNGAATPGTSSHGGFWERQQTLAIDYGNWSYVYNGDRAVFYRDARAVGFEPGLISPQRGYPDEPWHVVDKEPWRRVSAPAGGGAPAPATKPQEDDMSLIRWTSTGATFLLGFEKIYYISSTSMLPTLRERHGNEINVDNNQLTIHLNSENIPWGAMDAALKGQAQGDGKYWSRQTAEGEAARKTLEDVLETASRIEKSS